MYGINHRSQSRPSVRSPSSTSTLRPVYLVIRGCDSSHAGNRSSSGRVARMIDGVTLMSERLWTTLCYLRTLDMRCSRRSLRWHTSCCCTMSLRIDEQFSSCSSAADGRCAYFALFQVPPSSRPSPSNAASREGAVSGSSGLDPQQP